VDKSESKQQRLRVKTPEAFYVVVPRDRIELPTRGFSDTISKFSELL